VFTLLTWWLQEGVKMPLDREISGAIDASGAAILLRTVATQWRISFSLLAYGQ
jgi:hypothetical protein